MSWMRTAVAAAITVLAAAAGPASQAQTASLAPAPKALSVTLLGTAGGPGGLPERAGIATLISVGSRHFLVDAGEGVARQLARAGLNEAQVPTVFITHLHDDHTAGLPALMTFAWTLRSPKLELVGPPGTTAYFDAAMKLLSVNAGIRMAENPRFQPPEKIFSAREVQPGVVWAEGDLRISALENTHYRFPADKQAPSRSYSLKFEQGARKVVLSGDTGPSEALVEFARGADVLVCEIVSSQDIASVPPFVREHMLKEHLDATEVGKLAAQAQVGTLVLSHLRSIGQADVDEIRRHFKGTVVVGTDLAKF